MRNNIHQKGLYKEIYARGESTVWTQDDDENSYKSILDKLGEDWIRRQTVLDIGCGTGKYSDCLAKMGFRSVLGIDFVEIAISEAQRYREANLQFVCCDLFQWNLKERYGLLFDRGVFAHFEQELAKRYLYILDNIGTDNYKILFTCFAEEYHLTQAQKSEKTFFHNGLFFRKYTKDDLFDLFDHRFRVLKLDKTHKSATRVFWHLLAERKSAF